jgi:NNP family nitrate/nitrite transporter-like MFS transporter
MTTSFWKAGHTPTLFSAFLYFDLSFMVWYVLGPMGVQIAADLGLSTQQRAMMVATPILAGAVLRFLMGMLADRTSPKTAGLIGQVVVIAALFVAWQMGIHSYEQALLLGLFLGFAGASFAVALPLASQWYPPQHQGKAMGIAGAGNSGTVLAALFAPGLAALFGWSNVFGLALIPLVLTLIIFALAARNAPNRPAPKAMADYFKALGDRDSWWFMLFYSVTFGGFLGLASTLPGYFHDQYGLAPVTAGYYTAACVFAGSLRRLRRPRRRHPHPAGGLHSGIGVHRRRGLPHLQLHRRPGPVRGRHAQPGCRQRRGIPAGTPALPQGDRRDDRADRHGRRHRRLLPDRRAGRDQAAHW